ncbi:MAG: HEAT repeat domain-containing protein [Sulfurimonas sp.]
MFTQIKAELKINGISVNVGHDFLESIIGNIPDTPSNQALFEELADSDNYEIRKSIASKDNLNKKTVLKLLKDSNSNVVVSVLGRSDAAKHIDDEHMQELIDGNNIEILSNIASNIDSFSKCDQCKLVKKLSKHPNPKVRYGLVRWRTANAVGRNILAELANDEDYDVAHEAKKELKRLK